MEQERDRRAMQLAVANAEAQALRLGEAGRVWPRAARDLQSLLRLPTNKMPDRIECYDVSHSQGSHTVAARAVFIRGEPAKDLYRSYNIRSAPAGDDYAAIHEVITRRFRDRDTPGAEAWPDVVVIDGGKGQLGAALGGLEAAGMPTAFRRRVCAIAKRCR